MTLQGSRLAFFAAWLQIERYQLSADTADLLQDIGEIFADLASMAVTSASFTLAKLRWRSRCR